MGVAGVPEDPEKDAYTQAAYHERIWRENTKIQFVLYGHAHVSVLRPLEGDGDREVFYINTGTWRNRIYRTVAFDRAPDFVDLKKMTYTVIYWRDEDADGKRPNTLSFEIWTGMKKKRYC